MPEDELAAWAQQLPPEQDEAIRAVFETCRRVFEREARKRELDAACQEGRVLAILARAAD